jgi:regulator of RNase E activity RraB
VKKPAIDAERWQECWEEDSGVLRSLRSNGDVPDAIREVDVSFRGELSDLEQLAASCGNFGFAVQSLEADDDGKPRLSLVRNQQTDDATMREFTTTYLQIEDSFNVKSDGWGCMAHNNRGPISNENPA